MDILRAIILFVLIVSFAVAFFTYSFFWYEMSELPRRQALKASGKNLPKMMLYGLVSGAASIVMLILLYPIGFFGSLWRPKAPSPSGPVIVLVHGLYHNPSAWTVMKRRLVKAGLANVFVFHYWSFFTSFNAILDKLERFVGSLPVGPDQPLILVGHSLGGVVSRGYAQDRAGVREPVGVITLGTPHRGSKMVAFGIGGLAKSIGYGESLFEELDLAAVPPGCTAAAIFSPADNLVLPPESLQPPTGWSRYETGPMSHVSMLYSEEVADRVIEIIINEIGRTNRGG
jgi:triacylglycerol lipase